MTPLGRGNGGANRGGRGGFRGRGTTNPPQQFLSPTWQSSPPIADSSMASSSSSAPPAPRILPLGDDIRTPTQDIQPFSSQNDQVTRFLLRSKTPVNEVQDDRRAYSGAVTPLSQASTVQEPASVREPSPPLDDGTNAHPDGTHSDGVPSRDQSVAPRITVAALQERRPSA